MTEQSPSRSENFTAWLRHLVRRPVARIAEAFVRLKISPNAVTVVGFVLSAGAGLLVVQGRLVQAGLLYAIGTAFDGMDGTVARAAGRVTQFGGLLDSTLDRYGEALVLMALGVHLAQASQWLGLILTFVALIGSVMVSYIRARSEGLGIENKVGLLTRVERIIVLVLALLTRQIMIGLWVLAILTQLTVIQRIVVVYRASRAANKS